MKYEIGSRIRKYREIKGLSQTQLAKKIGVSSGRLSNWEQGMYRPNADILVNICKALDISPSELLDVQISTDNLSEQERKLVTAYRSKPELQKAVNILLGIDIE